MFLDKDEYSRFSKALLAFENRQPSCIAHHLDTCCQVARSWFVGTDKSSLIAQTASSMPVWIRERYQWGPSVWPMYWCQAISSETLDCGVLAALTRESLHARSVQVLPAQLIVWVTEQDCTHWSRIWQDKDIPCNWIVSPFLYHEVCAILSESGNEIKLWNPSDNCWIDPNQAIGYWRPVALRVLAERPTTVQWGNREVRMNDWMVMSDFITRGAG